MCAGTLNLNAERRRIYNSIYYTPERKESGKGCWGAGSYFCPGEKG
jgi:hypothetical protein